MIEDLAKMEEIKARRAAQNTPSVDLLGKGWAEKHGTEEIRFWLGLLFLAVAWAVFLAVTAHELGFITCHDALCLDFIVGGVAYFLHG